MNTGLILYSLMGGNEGFGLGLYMSFTFTVPPVVFILTSCVSTEALLHYFIYSIFCCVMFENNSVNNLQI